jgi:uncharacterized protein involved in exopolysaccharide biosynthesis
MAAAHRYFTDQAPEVALLRDRIDELKRQIDRIARQGGTLMVKGTDLPALKQDYLRVTREQLSLTAVSELLRRIYEQARVEESNPVATFSVLDQADLPERHSRPKRGMTVALTLLISAAFSMGYLEWKERRIDAARARNEAPSVEATETSTAEAPARRAA